MSFEPSEKQALFIWRLITAETPEQREPMISKARPELKIRTERTPLIEQGFVRLEARDRAKHYVLTDKAWSWAAGKSDVKLLKSTSRVGVEALQGLIRRLLPFLEKNDVPLALLFSDAVPVAGDKKGSGADTAHMNGRAHEASGSDASLQDRVENACLELAGGRRKVRVRLSALRRSMGSVRRDALDHALLALADLGKLALFRDDNSAALTADDHSAALLVGDAPRHLVYLEA